MTSIREQIGKLKLEGLKFSSVKDARKILLNYNYYYVINGYRDIFLDNSSERRKYKEGTSFDDIFSLYNFDTELKLLLLKYLFIVEQNIKSHLAYEFALLYGEEGYRNINNFSGDETSQKKFEELSKQIKKTIENNSKDDRIFHFKQKNKDIPIFVLVSLFDLGNTLLLYSTCKEGLKNTISKKYYNLSSTQFYSCLSVVKNFRNICAHGSRLFCVIIKSKELCDLPLHENMNLKHEQQNNKRIYSIGKKDLFSAVIALRYLLSEKDFKEFFDQLKLEIEDIKRKLGPEYAREIMGKMGFPERCKSIKQRGWKEILTISKEKAKTPSN